MSTSYVDKLRQKSVEGQRTQEKKKAAARRVADKKQKETDLVEAAKRIKEAEGPEGEITRATARGEREVIVCVLRGGIHFTNDFRLKQSPKFLGIIGKTIRRHFISKGLKVSFRYWMDEMRIGELESDTGYELVVSW